MGLTNTIHLLEEYGPVSPSTLTAPVRFPEVKFDDGIMVEEGTTNLVTNPSLETGMTGYAPRANVSLALVAAGGYSGPAALQVTAAGSPTAGSLPRGQSAPYPVTAGTTYTASVYGKQLDAAASIRIAFIFRDSAAATLLVVDGALTTAPVGQWVRTTVTEVAPAGAVDVILVFSSAALTLGNRCLFDAFQLEAKAYATSYTDGSLGSGFTRSRNLLPSAAATFEDGTTGGWTAVSAAALSNSTTQAFHGSRSLRTAGTNGSAGYATLSLPSLIVGRQYTFTAYVRPDVSQTIRARIDFTGGAAQGSVDTFCPANEWTRLAYTRTVPTGTTASTLVVTNEGSTANGFTVFIDAVQVEEGSTATAFTDDFGQGEDKTPGNLLPAAAQSFEDGTVGGWGPGVGTASSSTVKAFAGTRSLLLTTTGANAFAGAPNVPVVGGRTYTATAWINPSAARNIRTDILWFKADGTAASTSGTQGTGIIGTADVWQARQITAVAPADAAFARVRPTFADAVNGDLFYIDAVRLSEGTADAAYRWTGAEHASTSVRAAGRVRHVLPSAIDGPVTIACWFRPNDDASAEAFGGPLGLADATTRRYRVESSNSTLSLYLDGGSGPSIPLPYKRGDLVFVAGTLSGAASGSTATIYGSRNGAAVVSGQFTSTVVQPASTTVDVGTRGDGLPLRGGSLVEQVLVFNAALSADEIRALAFDGPRYFYDDPRIVYAAATQETKSTARALTAAGRGKFRRAATFAAELQPMEIDAQASPGVNNATHRITVPQGSGVGEGAVLSLDPQGRGTRYRVVRVFDNELYAVVTA